MDSHHAYNKIPTPYSGVQGPLWHYFSDIFLCHCPLHLVTMFQGSFVSSSKLMSLLEHLYHHTGSPDLFLLAPSGHSDLVLVIAFCLQVDPRAHLPLPFCKPQFPAPLTMGFGGFGQWEMLGGRKKLNNRTLFLSVSFCFVLPFLLPFPHASPHSCSWGHFPAVTRCWISSVVQTETAPPP